MSISPLWSDAPDIEVAAGHTYRRLLRVQQRVGTGFDTAGLGLIMRVQNQDEDADVLTVTLGII
nr:hypothetical protein [Acidimicrobiia bacterium]